MGFSVPDCEIICHLFETKVSWSLVFMAVSAISKYYVVDNITGTPIGQHPLVTIAKKAFRKQRPPIPRYHGTYNINIVLSFIENMRQNETLTLKQLSEKTVFLMVFLTLSRYCLALT